ncbi:hypothetical protein SEVIR_3G396566v4 [Setaria viridis]
MAVRFVLFRSTKYSMLTELNALLERPSPSWFRKPSNQTIHLCATLYRHVKVALMMRIQRRSASYGCGGEDQAAIKHLLRYIAETIEYGITYPRHEGARLELTGFSDSDMAGDVDGWRSTTGSSSSLDRTQFPDNPRSRRLWRYLYPIS